MSLGFRTCVHLHFNCSEFFCDSIEKVLKKYWIYIYFTILNLSSRKTLTNKQVHSKQENWLFSRVEFVGKVGQIKNWDFFFSKKKEKKGEVTEMSSPERKTWKRFFNESVISKFRFIFILVLQNSKNTNWNKG